MCYEYERFYWLERAEQARREKEKAEELKKKGKAAAPVQSDSPDTRVKEGEPVPA